MDDDAEHEVLEVVVAHRELVDQLVHVEPLFLAGHRAAQQVVPHVAHGALLEVAGLQRALHQQARAADDVRLLVGGAVQVGAQQAQRLGAFAVEGLHHVVAALVVAGGVARQRAVAALGRDLGEEVGSR